MAVAPTPAPVAPTGEEHLLFMVDERFRVVLAVDWVIIAIVIVLAVAFAFLRYGGTSGVLGRAKQYEVDEAQFGIGDQRIALKPNDVDRQIAYQIWVELTTRKIGLPINLDDDVLVEIYDSWHTFFTVTRELIKDVPVSKFRRKDTEKIIRLSIEVLNQGLRPHLTKWQARFRRWYDKKLDIDDHVDLEPQVVQLKFPAIEELRAELMEVNERLIAYRDKMRAIVTSS